MKFDYYADPGHEWLKVPHALLAKIGVADKITHFSYTRGKYAYLEGDCDCVTFNDAMRAVGKTIEVRSHYTDRRSKIRSYDHYHYMG